MCVSVPSRLFRSCSVRSLCELHGGSSFCSNDHRWRIGEPLLRRYCSVSVWKRLVKKKAPVLKILMFKLNPVFHLLWRSFPAAIIQLLPPSIADCRLKLQEILGLTAECRLGPIKTTRRSSTKCWKREKELTFYKAECHSLVIRLFECTQSDSIFAFFSCFCVLLELFFLSSLADCSIFSLLASSRFVSIRQHLSEAFI